MENIFRHSDSFPRAGHSLYQLCRCSKLSISLSNRTWRRAVSRPSRKCWFVNIFWSDPLLPGILVSTGNSTSWYGWHWPLTQFELYFYQTGFPVRLMKLLGVEKIILTNVSGALNVDYKVLINCCVHFVQGVMLQGWQANVSHLLTK